MKAFLILMVLVAFPSSLMARSSDFVLLSYDTEDARHARFHPQLSQNSHDLNCVNVRIPWVDDGKDYWLVITSEDLPDGELNFRGLINDDADPSRVLLISPLAQTGGWVEGSFVEKPGFIDLTLRKSLLDRAYIFHDFANSGTLDGGFFYAIDLSSYPVEGVSGFHSLNLKAGITRSEVELQVADLLGHESDYFPHGNCLRGGTVKYLGEDLVLEVMYKPGTVAPRFIDNDSESQDLPRQDETVLEFEIKRRQQESGKVAP